MPLGSDGLGLLRLKDHDITRQKGKGSHVEGKEERALSDDDIANTEYINIGSTAASGSWPV
jgi:hypothetical protein